ncbi:hypothetical protein [Blastomonas sp.]|uniref:hypothetical protein n=1 Tax=Blastomonas sp. TaxID=1909299 RepID=UPI002631E0D4|nr:hypothetical protein [Blastomonas sp.]MDM7955372.1 hypothetical protein [Blastomonas sp.]
MLFAAALTAFSALLVPPATAQDAQDDTQLPEPEQRDADQVDAKVKQLIRKADEWTGKEARAKRCQPGSGGDAIVVCGETDPSAKFRVPPDTEGRLATGGPPPAPDVAGDGIFKGKATFSGCMIPPCPPPPAYLIDFSKLPEVDEEYLKRARAAEAAERLRETSNSSGGPQ